MYGLNILFFFSICFLLIPEALSNNWNKKAFDYSAIDNFLIPQDETILVSDAIMVCDFSSSKKPNDFWTTKLKLYFNDTFLWSYKEGSNYRMLFTGKRTSKRKPYIIKVSREKKIQNQSLAI